MQLEINGKMSIVFVWGWERMKMENLPHWSTLVAPVTCCVDVPSGQLEHTGFCASDVSIYVSMGQTTNVIRYHGDDDIILKVQIVNVYV